MLLIILGPTESWEGERPSAAPSMAFSKVRSKFHNEESANKKKLI